MKKLFKNYVLLTMLLAFVFSSCRNEELESVQESEQEVLVANSALAMQMQNVAANDGSSDVVVYPANCFSIQLPVTVTVNGVEITINSAENYDDVEDLLDEFDDDDDEVVISFPITIILPDYTEVEINSIEELETYANQCGGEDDDDDDIECVDFVYPISASLFNANNEVIATITFNNDAELYEFIDDIDEEDLVSFDFPLTLETFDGITLTINDFEELEEVIDIYEDACDEDDDYDYNDDDCNNCTTDQLTEVLTSCDSWFIDELERNDNDLEDDFEGYSFTFSTENTVTVSWSNEIAEGTWTSSGSGNAITVEINIPGFNDLNDTWNLSEIEVEDDEKEVELYLGDDELEFKTYCGANGDGDDDDDDDDDDGDDDNEGSNADLDAILTDGTWFVASYEDDNDIQTANYNGYEFSFSNDGTVVVANEESTTGGTWQSNTNGLSLYLGEEMPLEELNDDDWVIVSMSETEVVLEDESGDESTDVLTFQKL